MAFSSSFSISPRLIEEILRNKNKKKSKFIRYFHKFLEFRNKKKLLVEAQYTLSSPPLCLAIAPAMNLLLKKER